MPSEYYTRLRSGHQDEGPKRDVEDGSEEQVALDNVKSSRKSKRTWERVNDYVRVRADVIRNGRWNVVAVVRQDCTKIWRFLRLALRRESLASVSFLIAVYLVFCESLIFNELKSAGDQLKDTSGAAKDWLLLFGQSVYGSALSYHPIIIIGFISMILALIPRCSWDSLAPSSDTDPYAPYKARLFLLMSTITSLEFILQPHDFWLNDTHKTNRVALLIFLILQMAHPLFHIPWLWYYLRFTSLESYVISPAWAMSQTETIRFFPLYTLFLIFILTRCAQLPVYFEDMVVSSAVIMSSGYIVPALGKLELHWQKVDEIWYISAASYVQAGVLAWLPHTIRGIVWWITLKLNKVLIYFTLATEMSGYVLCMHWTVFCAATVGLFLLHVGIYVMSGIWFRALALVDLAQAIYIWRLPPARRRRLFSWGLALFCLFYALELHHQDKPGVAVRSNILAWYDTPLAFQWRFDAIDNNGNCHSIPLSFFTPYTFELRGNFHAEVGLDQQSLSNQGTTWKLDFLKALKNAPNVEAVAAMRRRRVRAVRNHPNLEDLFSHFFSMDDPFWDNLPPSFFLRFWKHFCPPMTGYVQLPGMAEPCPVITRDAAKAAVHVRVGYYEVWTEDPWTHHVVFAQPEAARVAIKRR